MLRINMLCFLFCGLITFCASSQSIQPRNQSYTYYPPSKDSESWQRLNLQQSSTFLVVASEGQRDHDTSLYLASRSIGLSRYPLLAEGLNDPELKAQSWWIDTHQPGTGVHLLSAATGQQRLKLLVLLGAYYAFEPGNYRRYRDSVEYFLNRAIKESNAAGDNRLRRIAQCLLGKMYVQVNDAKGDIIFNQLIEDCRKSGDREMTARAFTCRGIYTGPTHVTFAQKISDLQKATDLYDSLNNKEAAINTLTGLGYMLVVSLQLDGAKQALLKGLTLAEDIHFPYTQYISDALSLVTLMQGKFGEPFRYSLQSMKAARETRDSLGWGFFYSRRADLYDIEGRYNESFEMMEQAANRFIADRNLAVYTILGTIVDRMGNAGQAKEAFQLARDVAGKVGPPQTLVEQFHYYQILSNCHIYLGMLDTAYFFAKKMDSLEARAELIRGPFRRETVNEQFGYIHLRRREYLKAREYLEKYFSNPSNANRLLSTQLANYRMLIRVDSALGDKTAALLHYEKYVQLLDSNFRITKIRQAEELQVLYNTQEKEKEIIMLNQSSTLKDANLKQANLLRNLTLAGIAGMIVIAVLLYRQNKLRKRNSNLISQKNEQLEELLEDREWLLKEIHHRVKNNLQIVTSLLSSQAIYINNEAAHAAIQDSKRRVFAMSLIHQKLYQSNNIATIAMAGYVNELIMHVQTSLGSGNRITIEQDIAPLNLDVSQAIPIGLIINECVVNSIKYAFPDNVRGMVRISLQKDEADHITLTIADNGIGLPLDFDITEQNSLGMELVRGLAKQLKGHLNVESGSGLHIVIRFALLKKQIEETPATIH
ncbi:ATP-binding protein [Terrimonas sp. NA20]|uniref:histidine kinase n=1 Tax=Terrimonas ginsenosidimutans TaxID=2908004 RepID=A0ABS9KV38_9BACT|nr:histidine kinase dimerization/phosphoacceptor domain -containing protein [Terrimonas ginsenosidimutans]MCG2616191.1 ATP-binding protein [Terrimonas ginsenosidimutans]